MKDIQTSLLSAFEASGLTYDELAKRTNLPKSALHRYINGDTEKIPIDRFQSICDELHADASVILGWVSEPPEEDETEKALITIYRSLTVRGKALMMERANELKLLHGKKSEGNSAKSL